MVNMVNKSWSMQICGYFPNYSHCQTCSKTSFARVNSAYNTAVRHFELKVSSHVTTRCFDQTSSAAHGAGHPTGRKFEYSSWLVPWMYPCLSYGQAALTFSCPGSLLASIWAISSPSKKIYLSRGRPHGTFFEPSCIRWFCTAHLLLRITRWPP